MWILISHSLRPPLPSSPASPLTSPSSSSLPCLPPFFPPRLSPPLPISPSSSPPPSFLSSSPSLPLLLLPLSSDLPRSLRPLLRLRALQTHSSPSISQILEYRGRGYRDRRHRCLEYWDLHTEVWGYRELRYRRLIYRDLLCVPRLASCAQILGFIYRILWLPLGRRREVFLRTGYQVTGYKCGIQNTGAYIHKDPIF